MRIERLPARIAIRGPSQGVARRGRRAARTSQVNVRRAIAGDEHVLRALRIEALTDAPHAFDSTLERELARTRADWARWLAPGATFILEQDGVSRGLVSGARDVHDESVVFLMAMWVHPAMRGTGGGDALVGALVDWATSIGARTVRLVVVRSNEAARRLYERQGFAPNGEERVRDRDGEVELTMERPTQT